MKLTLHSSLSYLVAYVVHRVVYSLYWSVWCTSNESIMWWPDGHPVKWRLASNSSKLSRAFCSFRDWARFVIELVIELCREWMACVRPGWTACFLVVTGDTVLSLVERATSTVVQGYCRVYPRPPSFRFHCGDLPP